MSTHTPLTVGDLTLLGELATTVQHGKPITRLIDGETQWGIARAFTREGGGFLASHEDVRDGFVWVSGGSGLFERWWPVSELLAGLQTGEVALDYRPVSP